MINPLAIDSKCSIPQIATLRKRPTAYRFMLYLLIGTSVCFAWNALVNSLSSLTSMFFPNVTQFSVQISASYNSSVLIGALLFLKIGVGERTCLSTGLIGTALSSFLFVSISCFMRKSPHSLIITLLCVTITCLLGIFVGIALTSAFALASTSTSDSAAVSIGMGGAGLLTFIIWLTLSRTVFPLQLSESSISYLQLSLLSITAIQILIALLSVIGVSLFLRDSLVDPIDITTITDQDEGFNNLNDEDDSSNNDVVFRSSVNLTKSFDFQYNSPSWFMIFQICHSTIISLFITLALTLYLFPTIWPLTSFPNTPLVTDVLMGAFQWGDFIGRCCPMFLPQISSKSTTIISILRFFIFLSLFFITSPSISSYSPWMLSHLFNPYLEGFFILLLALTNGYIATLGSIHITQYPKIQFSSFAKSRASTFGLFAVLGGISFGSSLSIFNPLK